MTDWLGIGISVTIILFIILIVWARMQGDRVVDVLAEIRDLLKGDI